MSSSVADTSSTSGRCEVVTAVVVPADTPDTDGLLEHAAGLLAPYKRPRVVRYVDELPRNATGKILRKQI